MRGVIVAAFLGLGLVSPAGAGDLDFLRGSRGSEPVASAYHRWSGFYAGGQASLGFGNVDFPSAATQVVGTALANTMLESEAGVSSWVPAGRADTGYAAGFGGFVGYNFQWDEIVFGVEANYTRTDLTAQSSGSMSRVVTLSDEFAYDVTSTVSSTMKVTDIGTLRARIGYAFDRFLGYVTIGGALGYATYGTSAVVSYPAPTYVGATVPAPPNPGAASASAFDGRSNAPIHGYAFGLGLDMALGRNLFVRGEYEYIQFSRYNTGVNNVRGAIGLKF